MSKQQDPGYKPLSMHARWKLNRAVKALRSPFHSVRAAAHREIQKILAKAQQRGQRIQKAVKDRLKREPGAPRQRSDRPARPPRPKRHQCGCGKSFHSEHFFKQHARKHAPRQPRAQRRSKPAAGQAQGPVPAGRVLNERDLKDRQFARKHPKRAARKAAKAAGNAPAAAPAPPPRTPQTARNLGNGPVGPQEMHQREHDLDAAFTAKSKQRAAQERAARNGKARPKTAQQEGLARSRTTSRSRPGDPAETRRYAANLRKRAAGAESRGLKEYPELLRRQAAQADARARQYARQATPVRVAPAQRGKSPAGRPAPVKASARPKTRQQEGIAARKQAPQTRTYIGRTTKQAGSDQRKRTADQRELAAQRQRPRTPTPAQARAARAPASRPAPRPASVPSLRPDRPRVPLPHQTVGAPSVRAPRTPGTRRLKVPFRRSR